MSVSTLASYYMRLSDNYLEIENETNKFASNISTHKESLEKSMDKTETYFTKLKSLNEKQLKEHFGLVEKVTEETHSIVRQQGEDISSFIPITLKHLEFTKELRNKMEVMGNEMEVMGNKMEVMRSEINKTKILSEYRDWIRDYIKIVKREAKFNSEELDNITDYWEKEQEDEEQEDVEQEDVEQEDVEQEDEEQEDEKVDKMQEDEKEKNDVTTKLEKLEVFLQNDSLTLSEFMELFRVREESNITFHRDEKNPRKAKDKLEDGNFPKDLEQIKEPLGKILDAILIRKRDRNKRRKQRQAKNQMTNISK